MGTQKVPDGNSEYRISSNNSRPSINRHPWIIATPPPPPTLLAIFCFFYPLPVKFKWNLIQQNWLVTIQQQQQQVFSVLPFCTGVTD